MYNECSVHVRLCLMNQLAFLQSALGPLSTVHRPNIKAIPPHPDTLSPKFNSTQRNHPEGLDSYNNPKSALTGKQQQPREPAFLGSC